MGITDKYEFETTNYGTTGWNALLATSLEKADDFIHTYLRYPVKTGETIVAYDPVHLVNGEWEKAAADGSKQPAFAIAIEANVSGEYLRAQHVGPITNTSWAFSAGAVYLGADGSLTQTPPESNVFVVGYAINSTSMLLYPSSGSSSETSSGEYVPLTYLQTSLGTPGSDTKVPTEQAVREALNHDHTALSDHSYTGSTMKMPVYSGESQAFGNVMYVSGEYARKSSNASSLTMPVWFMATSNANGGLQEVLGGPNFVRDESWSFTAGSMIYASTSGELTQTRPSTTGNQVQILGVAVTSKKILFNPSPVIVEV